MVTRLLTAALLAGLVTGACATIVQMSWAVPLIHAAEEYEQAAAGGTGHHAGSAHHGDAVAHHHGPVHLGSAWAPADGLERTFWTFVTNLSLSLGAALVMCGLFALRGTADPATGLKWGLIGFAAVSLAPALGLPPELPGSAAAALEGRQTWWLLTVAATLLAIILAVQLRAWWVMPVAAGLAALPHLAGAPQPQMHGAVVPVALQQEFIAASLFSMLVFWLVAGAATGGALQRIFPSGALSGSPAGSTGASS